MRLTGSTSREEHTEAAWALQQGRSIHSGVTTSLRPAPSMHLHLCSPENQNQQHPQSHMGRDLDWEPVLAVTETEKSHDKVESQGTW